MSDRYEEMAAPLCLHHVYGDEDCACEDIGCVIREAVDAEIEECAKVAEERAQMDYMDHKHGEGRWSLERAEAAEEIAELLRARKSKGGGE